MDLVDIFNQKTMEFVSDVGQICPDVKDLQPLVRMGLNMDRMAALHIFDKHAKKYESHIVEKDESFFLEEQYDGENMDIIFKLKSVWTTLTPSNKEAIWKYVQLLLLLYKKHKEVTSK